MTAILLAVMLLCPDEVFVLSVFIICIVAVFEMDRCLKAGGYRNLSVLGYVGSLSILLAGAERIYNINVSAGVYILAGFVALSVLAVYMITEFPDFSIGDLAVSLFGNTYVISGFMCCVLIRLMDYGNELFWILILGAWLTDVFAYLVGSLIGRTHFLKKVSPKKSLEGTIGAIVGTTVVLSLVCMYIFKDIPVDGVYLVLIVLLCSVFAQLGDWIMSAFKRLADIKDFGKLIPGHGGIIDRFDSVLFIAPMMLGILMIVA